MMTRLSEDDVNQRRYWCGIETRRGCLLASSSGSFEPLDTVCDCILIEAVGGDRDHDHDFTFDSLASHEIPD